MASGKRLRVTIREYKAGDRAAMVRILNSLKDYITSADTFGTEGRMPGFGNASLVELLGSVSDGNGIIYVAEDANGAVVGACTAITKQDRLSILGSAHGTKTGEIRDLYVARGYRDHGVGAMLMDKAEHYLLRVHCTHIEVGVFWPNRHARKFYTRLGYNPYNITYIKRAKPRHRA